MRRPAKLLFRALTLAAVLFGLAACVANATLSASDNPPVTDTPSPAPTEVTAATRELLIPTPETATAEPKAEQAPAETATTEPALPTDTPTIRPTATAIQPTSTSTVLPTATPIPTLPTRVEPRLIIPAINVDAVVVPVGLDGNGAMAAPEDWFEIGWFRYGPRPGFAGSAALAGHLDTNTGAPATFWDLNKLVPGQEVVYQAEDASRLTFVVDEVATYPWDEVPLDRVFARSGEPRLSLITCGGQWSREHRNYSHRTIVYASLP
jgi:sortase (surface protein transpeptidase)